MNEIKNILDKRIYEKICNFKFNLEEIRLRENKKLSVKVNNKIITFDNIIIKEEDINYTLNKATNYSIHTYLEYLKRGFITINGGHRLGVSGDVICEDGKILNFRKITSINLRIAKEIFNINIPTKLKNTLIISPPNLGKTTLLRHIIKNINDKNISVIDERFEIASGFNLGDNVDVLAGMPKKDAVFLMLKTMAPEYLVLDEITDDTKILDEIANSGVYIIATIHSENLEVLKQNRNNILKYFDNFIEIYFKENIRQYNVRGSDYYG